MNKHRQCHEQLERKLDSPHSQQWCNENAPSKEKTMEDTMGHHQNLKTNPVEMHLQGTETAFITVQHQEQRPEQRKREEK